MNPYHEQPGIRIFHGKAEEVLPTFAPDRFSTVITDPPYELGFMNKGWDRTGIAFRPELWAEVLRVCKPGAMLLAFGGSRTHHRLACAIEDAGWELRDSIFWCFGSGFPKSLDLSKAIDKAAGAQRAVSGVKVYADGTPGHWGVSDKFAQDTHTKSLTSGTPKVETIPATDAARQWSGWGTALKPAFEIIYLAMKPLDGTFAENAQRHGVAGLNIDGGRIGSDRIEQGRAGRANQNAEEWRFKGQAEREYVAGRWPANVILDEAAAAQLDQMSGTLTSGNGLRRPYDRDGSGRNAYGYVKSGQGAHPYDRDGDSGGASRFFYTAKASKSDRGHGNDHATVKPTALLKYLCKLTATPTGGEILDPFGGSMTTLVAARECGRPAVAIEMVEDHCRIGVSRLAQFSLFPLEATA